MLYTLTERFRELDAILDAEEGVTEDEAAALDAARDAIIADLPGEVANAIRYIQTLQATHDATTVEAARLRAIAERTAKKAERVKALCIAAFDAAGVTTVKTPVGALSVQPNGGKPSLRIIVQVESLPDSLTKQPPRIADTDALRALAESMPDNGLAVLEPRGRHVRLR